MNGPLKLPGEGCANFCLSLDVMQGKAEEGATMQCAYRTLGGAICSQTGIVDKDGVIRSVATGERLADACPRDTDKLVEMDREAHDAEAAADIIAGLEELLADERKFGGTDDFDNFE